MPLDFDEIFEGARVPAWLRAFAEDADGAVADLLVGRADLGHLAMADPVQLLLDWLHRLSEAEGFAAQVDASLAAWIRRCWGDTALDEASGSPAMTAVAWCRASEAVAGGAPHLKEAAGELELRLLDIDARRFLRDIGQGRSRDPEGRAWLALARNQDDRSLLDTWWGLCALPADQPWYRGEYGIHGLCGLPGDGGFPEEAAEGLARLAQALERRSQSGFLNKKTAEKEFLRTTRLTMAAYPFPEDWNSFWRHASDGVLQHDETVLQWVKQLLPKPRAGKKPPRHEASRQPRRTARNWREPDPAWTRRAQGIAQRLGERDWSALPEAEKLLEEQRRYAAATGNTYNIVRTACSFAGKTRETRSDLALDWAEMAREFEPWNAYAWTVSATALLSVNRKPEALSTAAEAVRRFPNNAVARNGLAETLRQMERFEDAEAEYRDTKERFPNDDVARNGLAETLRQMGRPEDAEAEYRDTKERFPNDAVARTGLAETLRQMERLKDAEAEYRQATKRFPDNAHARTGLAETLRQMERLEDAEAEYRQAIKRFPNSAHARTGLEAVVRARASANEARTTDNVPSTFDAFDIFKAPRDSSGGLLAQRTFAPMCHPAGDHLEPAMDIEPLLTDAYLVRRWARHVEPRADATAVARYREKALRLLTQLEDVAHGDARALGAYGCLGVDSGDLDSVLALLREASSRFPGSAYVRYALARAEREAARREERHLDASDPNALVMPWRRLARMSETYRPVGLLGEGRAWLVQVDGHTVEDGARDALGRLARWIRRKVAVDSPPEAPAGDLGALRAHFLPEETDDVYKWWAAEVQIRVFDGELVGRADDIEDIEAVRDRLGQHRADLDNLEEELVVCSGAT